MKGTDRRGVQVEVERPPKLDGTDLDRIRDHLLWAMRRRGYRLRELGRIFGLGAATVYRILGGMTPEDKASV